MRILISAMIISLVCGCSSEPPTDAQMLAVFQNNKTDFELLRDHLCKNDDRRMVMMDPEWSKPPTSEADKKTLYSIFKRIGAKGVYYDGNCSLRVAVWSVGLGGDGDYKYYSYRPQESIHIKTQIVSSLDEVDRASLEHAYYLRPISEGWYLALDHWP